MIIICEAKATEAQIHSVQLKIREAGLDVHRSDGAEYTVLGVVGDRNRLDVGSVQMMPGLCLSASIADGFWAWPAFSTRAVSAASSRRNWT